MGSYVAFEGLYGAGKTTAIARLVAGLGERGVALQTFEWNSTPVAAASVELKKEWRLDACSLLFLEMADFHIVMRDGLDDALAGPEICIGDRSVYSAMVRSILRGADPTWVGAVTRAGRSPDLVVYLDVPPDVCTMRRMQNDRPWNGYVSGEDFLDEQISDTRFYAYQRAMDGCYRNILPAASTLYFDPNDGDEALMSKLLEFWGN